MDWLGTVKGWIRGLTGVGLALIPLGILIQVITPGTSTFLVGDILPNLMGLIRDLGNAGLVGLIALGIVIWLFRGLKAD